MMTRMIYGLIVLLILVFAAGFIPGRNNLFILPLVMYAVLAAVLLTKTIALPPDGVHKVILLIAGTSALAFSISVTYSVLGIKGYYPINDVLYIGGAITSLIVFLASAIASIVISR